MISGDSCDYTSIGSICMKLWVAVKNWVGQVSFSFPYISRPYFLVEPIIFTMNTLSIGARGRYLSVTAFQLEPEASVSCDTCFLTTIYAWFLVCWMQISQSGHIQIHWVSQLFCGLMCQILFSWQWICNYAPRKTLGIDSLVPGDVISDIPASSPQAQTLFMRYRFSGYND